MKSVEIEQLFENSKQEEQKYNKAIQELIDKKDIDSIIKEYANSLSSKNKNFFIRDIEKNFYLKKELYKKALQYLALYSIFYTYSKIKDKEEKSEAENLIFFISLKIKEDFSNNKNDSNKHLIDIEKYFCNYKNIDWYNELNQETQEKIKNTIGFILS